jgi:hypothetical protein
VKSTWVAALLALLGAVPLAAQEPTVELFAGVPWRLSYFPYLTANPNDGVMGLMRVIRFRQGDDTDRFTLRDAVSLEAGYSTHKSWRITTRGDFPALGPGWRGEFDGELYHTDRFGNPDVPDTLSRQYLGAELSRRMAGPLYLAVRGDLEHRRDLMDLSAARIRYSAAPLTIPCATPGGIPINCSEAEVDQTDIRGRVALVLDLRDREYDTRSGLLVQAGVFGGSAADGYRGYYALANVWSSPTPVTTFTARAGLRDVSPTGAVGILTTMPAWEDEFTTLGGPQSDRALAVGQDVGRGLLLAGAEVRQAVYVSRFSAVSLLAFLDAGRIFRDPTVCPQCDNPLPNGTGDTSRGELDLTLHGWTVGLGGGAAVRVLRNAILTFTAARARHRTRIYVSSGWAW